MARSEFYRVVDEAIADLSTHGFDSMDRVAYWEEQLRVAAERAMVSPVRMEQMLREALAAIFHRLVDRGGIVKFHSGVERWKIDKIKPSLRAELDRRIMASANLIRLNRREAINKTLSRFSGWATSIPKGGSDAVDKRKTKQDVRKSLAQLPFVERRVLIDQGHKLSASLNEIVAKDGDAIALRWHSNWRQQGYDFREDHKERDGQIYLMRDNWAQAKGLVKVGPSGYYDKITAVAEEPFCRCYAEFLYNLRSLPKEMLTKKGQDALTEARERIGSLV